MELRPPEPGPLRLLPPLGHESSLSPYRGLVSGACAKSKRYAKAADRKRKGYRKPPLRRPVSSTSVWERLAGSDARVSEYAIHSGIREGGRHLPTCSRLARVYFRLGDTTISPAN